MHDPPNDDQHNSDGKLTFPVYATAEPWGFSQLHLPMKQVDVPDSVVDATLTLIEQSATKLGTAGDGEQVAHVYVTRQSNRVMGWTLTEPFRP